MPTPISTTCGPDSPTPGGQRRSASNWSQGIPLNYTRELADYWAGEYDWRAREEALNRFDQFTTEIDGLEIHFIHQRSRHSDAFPLLLTHGWPGSIVEFHKVIGPLTEHGFDVVCPSLPGYGFSAKPNRTGWGVEKMAAAWETLMGRLGYERYGAQGGDWGASVTTQIGRNGGRCIAIHLNMQWAAAKGPHRPDRGRACRHRTADLLPQVGQRLCSSRWTGRGRLAAQVVVDWPSTAGLLIVEKFWSWSGLSKGAPENVLHRDELLDNVMLYWLTASGASSARLYWESFASFRGGEPVTLPTGVAAFPRRSFAHRAAGVRNGSTSRIGRRCRAAGTLPRSNSPSFSSTTYGRTSHPCARHDVVDSATPARHCGGLSPVTLPLLIGMLVVIIVVVHCGEADGIGTDADVHVAQSLGGRELTVTIRRVGPILGPLHVDVVTHRGDAPGTLQLTASAPGATTSSGRVDLGPPGIYSATLNVDRAGPWELIVDDGRTRGADPFLVPAQVVPPWRKPVTTGSSPQALC